MEPFLQSIARLLSSWRPWCIVAPWEIGVRVRLGRNAASLKPGPHFRIPFLDRVILVNTRQRIAQVPQVTIAAEGGRARVIRPSVGFSIVDPVKAMQFYSAPEAVVGILAQAQAASLATPDESATALRAELGPRGVRVDFVRYVEDVTVRTFRLLNEGWTIGHVGDYCSPAQTQERY